MHASEAIAIKVEHLSKQYLIGRDRRADETLREALTRAFMAPFRRSAVSTLDYYHPSLAGQARLASITWGAGWWG